MMVRSDVTFVNHVNSHDDGWPFDLERKRTKSRPPNCCSVRTGADLLQNRNCPALIIEVLWAMQTLRGKIDWGENPELLKHWQKAGTVSPAASCRWCRSYTG